jgi:ABC-type glutathione transport system ATPase component
MLGSEPHNTNPTSVVGDRQSSGDETETYCDDDTMSGLGSVMSFSSLSDPYILVDDQGGRTMVKGTTLLDMARHEKTAVNVTFDGLTLSVKKDGGTKTVFRDLSGMFHGAMITAIMGPSGCGKTSLMNAISGRASYAKVHSFPFGRSSRFGLYHPTARN